MRFLHLNVDGLCSHIESLGLLVAECARDKSSRPRVVPITVIKEMLQASKQLWGAISPNHLSVSKSAEAEAAPLSSAVVIVEAGSGADRFLLVPYEDGGIVSVSGTLLAFQVGARPAEWWRR